MLKISPPSVSLTILAAAIGECLKGPGELVISRSQATVAQLALAEIISHVEVLEQTQAEATALARQLRHAEVTIDRLSERERELTRAVCDWRDQACGGMPRDPELAHRDQGSTVEETLTKRRARS